MTREDAGLLREWQAVGEWARLLADPIYRGRGVPRGDGRAVLVVPGLFGNDLYLQPLRSWLRRIGYRPVRSSIALHAGCHEQLSRRVERSLAGATRSASGPVALLGHSRGGMLARAIAARLGERASHLLLLGAPVGAYLRLSQDAFERGTVPPGGSQHVARAGLRARRQIAPDCTFPGCACAFTRDLRHPLAAGTRVLSIYSRDDGIVHPLASATPGARHVEVTGTHSGLVYNPAVYSAVARELASTD